MTETPTSGSVARASGLMIAAIFLSRVLGQVRDTVIAYKFGQGADADMYRAAFTLPDLFFFLLAGGALSSAFIPVFSEYLHNKKEEQAWELFSILSSVMGLAVVAIVIVMAVFAVPLVRLAFAFPEAQIQETAQLSRIILPAQIAFLIGGLMFGTFYARHLFLMPALAPNIYNIGIIAGALILTPFVHPPISGLVWGALAGAFLGSLILPGYVFFRTGGQFRPSLQLKNEQVVRVFKLMLPVILGLSLPGVYAIVVRSMASWSEVPGSVAAIENANRLMQAPLGIFGQALALAVFPSLSLFAARKEMENFSGTLNRSLRAVLFLTIPAGLFLALFPEELLRVLLQYGRFHPEDTAYAAQALRMFAIGVPAWSAQAILMRGFFALQDTITPIVLGTITTLIFLPLSWFLLKSPLGYAGLALAVSISATLLFVSMVFAMRRKQVDTEFGKLGRIIIASLFASGVAGGIGWLAWWGIHTLLAHVLRQPNLLSAAGILGAFLSLSSAYLLMGKVLGIEETKYATNMIARRFGAGKNKVI